MESTNQIQKYRKIDRAGSCTMRSPWCIFRSDNIDPICIDLQRHKARLLRVEIRTYYFHRKTSHPHNLLDHCSFHLLGEWVHTYYYYRSVGRHTWDSQIQRKAPRSWARKYRHHHHHNNIHLCSGNHDYMDLRHHLLHGKCLERNVLHDIPDLVHLWCNFRPRPV